MELPLPSDLDAPLRSILAVEPRQPRADFGAGVPDGAPTGDVAGYRPQAPMELPLLSDFDVPPCTVSEAEPRADFVAEVQQCHDAAPAVHIAGYRPHAPPSLPGDVVQVAPKCKRPLQFFRPGCHFRNSHADTVHAQTEYAQTWLNTRLSNGLKLCHLHLGSVAIYTALAIDVPDEFLQDSHNVSVLSGSDSAISPECAVVLLFCDIFDNVQMQQVTQLRRRIASLGSERPQTILIPHSSGPDLEGKAATAELVMSTALRDGIDGVVIGEPTGVKLALEVQSKLMSLSQYAQARSAALDDHRSSVPIKAAAAEVLKQELHDMVWEYLRRRLRTTIPDLDGDIDISHSGAVVDDFRLCAKIGEGAYGKVYSLVSADNGSPSSMVLKTIAKEHITSYFDLKILGDEIMVMEELSSFPHPNIIRLFEVYHGPTHILLRMQDGGPRNLYSYLSRLEEKRSPLGLRKATAMIKQCCSALYHLHARALIVHRDIKPENIIPCETVKGIIVRLCDFGDASLMVKARTPLCHRVCGTFPFMAPEIIARAPYDPFPADVWSMGIVLLEVLCCTKVLTKVLLPGLPCSEWQEQKQALGTIRDFFEQPENLSGLLEQKIRPTLTGILDTPTKALLEGMMCVQVSRRATAASLQSETNPE